MSIIATYLGAQSIGASDQDPAADIDYCVPITVTDEGLAVGIEAAVSDGDFRLAAYLLADNGGAPGDIIGIFQRDAQASVASTTDRWLVVPMMVWLAAGNYWVGVQSTSGVGQGQLKFDSGASGDGFTVDGGTTGAQHEPGATGVTSTATDRFYSIRLVMLTDTPAITGSIAATQAAQVAAFTGTVTPPTPPPTPSGNRIGGTGAIRKPPRPIG